MSIFDTTFTVYPEHCNYMTVEDGLTPMVHGGALLLKMDRAASDCVRLLLFKNNVEFDQALTVAVEHVEFLRGAKLGDLLDLQCIISKSGITSLTIGVNVYRQNKDGEALMARGKFRFAIRKNNRGVKHGI